MERVKLFNVNNKIEKQKEYNGLNKRVNSIIKYFNKDEQENIMEIINIRRAEPCGIFNLHALV